jgi:type I restriction enzyme S subunit
MSASREFRSSSYIDGEGQELPEGWANIPLGEFAHSMANGIYKPSDAYAEDGLPCLRMYNIQEGKIALIDVKRMRLTPEELAKYQLLPDDILLNRVNSRELVGKAAICEEFAEPTVFESKNIRLRLMKSCVVPAYVNMLLQAPEIRQKLSDGSKQTVGMATVSQPLIRNLVLPFPPLVEQKRIVAKVEELLAWVNAARERVARVPAILKRFRQSVLAAACSGRLTADWSQRKVGAGISREDLRRRVEERSRQSPSCRVPAGLRFEDLSELPAGWCWASVEELASGEPHSMQSGPFGSNLLHAEFQDQGILAIGIDNVQDGSFSMGREHRISKAKYEELRKYTARPLDVLITVMATVGRVCVLPETLEPAVITKHVYRISVDKEIVNPSYLALALREDSVVQPQIRGAIIGQTRPGINGRILKRIGIPLPPLAEQREIVRRVEALFALADAIEKRVAAARLRVEKLTQAVLARAFRGELVPTEAELARREGRAYEPAAALLERIRAERGQGTGATTARRARSRPADTRGPSRPARGGKGR